MIDTGKYISQNGIAYEVVAYAIDSETDEQVIIYREVYNKNKMFTCTEKWWESQAFIPIGNYTGTGVTMYSSEAEKINLFISLFIGRDDVYAKRWESKKGGAGYSPVCLNEWVPGVCLKPDTKCAECNNKSYAPISYSVIENHLRGYITVGIYPLLKDETCKFLVIDFDDENWMADISAVRELCDAKSIPVYIERSRSGSGGHIWMFFDESIPAITARKLGSCILTAAMNERHEIKFSSYDRLFPNQDTMPKGGFGNLIALPLQKHPRTQGNSMFVNEHFQAYADQWSFLDGIKRLSECDVKNYIKLLGNSEIGELYEDTTDKPWEKKKAVVLSKTDFPDEVNVVLSNLIYIEKTSISPKGLSQLKRLASFKNPDFYKTQAMRLSTYNKPRIISTFEESDNYIGLPRGLYDDIAQIFVNNGVDINISDKTNAGRGIDVEFTGKLRVEQAEALKTLLKKNCGVLSASTAFGKTVVGAALIAQRKTNTLILVHRTNLLKQWREQLDKFLNINETPSVEYTPKGRIRKKTVIGQISGTKHNPSDIVDVAVMQSLINNNEVSDIVKNYGMVIVDECHHVSAFSFEKILKTVNAKYVYGLTATPVRQDGHQPIIYMQCGNITYKADNKKQAQAHSFEHYMIPRFTPYRNISNKLTEIYSDIIEDELRNDMIADDCRSVLEEERTPIILTERTKHVDILGEKLKEYNVIKLVGGMGNKRNNEIAERLRTISPKDKLVIIATGKYVGEGFDFPRLDTLFLAMPISWKGTLQQYAGRLHRNYENKDEVRIYDYIDINVPMLERMYQKRLSGYSSIGYHTKCETELEKSINRIFNSKNFLELFVTDVNSATDNVLIVSPFVSKRTISKLMSIIDTSKGNITILTRPVSDYSNYENRTRVEGCLNILEKAGFKLLYKSMIHQKFAVIDKRIVWYGSINLLSYGNSEESIMRLESSGITRELIDSLGLNLTNSVLIGNQQSIVQNASG